MKLKFFLLTLLLLSIESFSQNNFKQVVDKINWHGTESEIVYSLYDYIEKSEREEWDSENTESNYSFKNIIIADIPVAKSYIRVNKDTKKIFRLNFIVLDEETDMNAYTKIEDYLKMQYGNSDNLTWIFDDYIMKALLLDISNASTKEIERYSYVIRLEPINSFYVDCENIIVECNNHGTSIPKFEYFKIDNENNVYIKEKGKDVIKKNCKKIYPTPKSDIIVFKEGGMLGYRKEENDIVYMNNGLGARYLILKKNIKYG